MQPLGALHVVGLDEDEGNCQLDGEYWFEGKTEGAPYYYEGKAPFYIRRMPTSANRHYLFYALDCWDVWDSKSGVAPSEEFCANETEMFCNLAHACYERLKCEGGNLVEPSWVITVASNDQFSTCNSYARVPHDDPVGPPAQALWKMTCPGVEPPVQSYETREPSILELVTTTTITTTSTTVSTTTTTTIHVEVDLAVSPTAGQPCNRAMFTAFVRVGVLLPMTFIWTWGLATPPAAQSALQAFIDRANFEGNVSEIALPLQAVDAIVSAGTVTIELAVTAKNREGTMATSIGQMLVQRFAPPPVLHMAGSAVVRARPGDTVSLAVFTGETAPICAAGSRRLIVNWEYSNPFLSVWVSLADLVPPLQSLSKLQRILQIAPFSFEPNSMHMFRTSAYYADEPSVMSSPVVYRVAIGRLPPPRAIILGPNAFSRYCDFVLRAKLFNDVNGTGHSDVSLEWSCALESPAGSPDLCKSLNNFATENARKTDGHGIAGQTFRVSGGQLSAGLYQVSLTIARRSGSGNSTVVFALQVLEDGAPPVNVDSPWEDMQRLSTSSEVERPEVVARMIVSPRPACSLPAQLDFQWVLVHLRDAGPLVISSIHSETLRRTSGTGESLEIIATDFDRSQLVSGGSYRYALFSAEDPSIMMIIKAALASLDLGQNTSNHSAIAEILNDHREKNGGVETNVLLELNRTAFFAWTPAFIADTPPVAGTVTAVPLTGTSVRTRFTVTAHQWLDDASAVDLDYAFYRFPNNVGVRDDVDWHDSSNPRYWSRLGGQQLRTWGPFSSLTGLLLPTGEHVIAARARDGLRGVHGAAFLQQPISVEHPVHGFNLTADVGEIFGAAASANSPDQLLTSVATVAALLAVLPSSAVAIAERQATASRALAVLDAAAHILTPTNELLEQVGLVVGSLVQKGGAATFGRNGLDKVLGIMQFSLDLCVSEAPRGIAKIAGDALLGGLNVVDNGMDLPASSYSEQKQAEASSRHILMLTQTLGRCVQRALRVDETQELAAGEVSILITRPPLRPNPIDLVIPGLRVPSRILQTVFEEVHGRGRRLQIPSVSSTTCGADAIDVHRTVWLQKNPHRHVANDLALNSFVLPRASVVVVRFEVCDHEIEFSFAEDEEPMHVELPFSQPTFGFQDASGNYKQVTTCAKFDGHRDKMYWTSADTAVETQPCQQAAGTCTCLAYFGGGSFTAFNTFEPNFTLTTTTTSTTTPQIKELLVNDGGLSVAVILILILLPLCCLCCGAVLIWIWLRHRKLSRIAPIGLVEEEEESENPSTPSTGIDAAEWLPDDFDALPETERRSAMEFKDLLERAINGDVKARETLLTNAASFIHPDPKLIAAVDDLLHVMQLERRDSRIRDLADAASVTIIPPSSPPSICRVRPLK